MYVHTECCTELPSGQQQACQYLYEVTKDLLFNLQTKHWN